MAKYSITAVLVVVHVCFVLGQQATTLDLDNSTVVNETATTAATVKVMESSSITPTRLPEVNFSSTVPPLVHNNALNASDITTRRLGKNSAETTGPMVGFVLVLLFSAMF